MPPPPEAKVSDENEWIRGVFEMYREVQKGPAEAVHWGHAAARWRSAFSLSIRSALLASSSRVYLVSGSEDRAAPIASMDALATDLIRARRDVIVQRVLGADHSLLVKGDDPAAKQREVIATIMRWAAGTPPSSNDIVWPLPPPDRTDASAGERR